MSRLLLVLGALLGCSGESESDFPGIHASPLSEIEATVATEPQSAWLKAHFETPVAPQGAAPEGREGPLAGISPEDCATCHLQQYEDWSQSWHALGMGPGMMGQLVDLDGVDDPQVAQCNRCHAPLSEQAPRISEEQADGSAVWVDNPHYVEAERTKGLTCVGCHVRQHERYGPGNSPAIVAASAALDAGEPVSMMHDGARVRPEFKSPTFCQTCHDFDQRPRVGLEFEEGDNPDPGVLVSAVATGAAAEAAGAMPGDRILSIDGESTDTRQAIKDKVELSGAGTEMLVRLLRDGEYLSMMMTPKATRSRPAGKMLQETTDEWRRTRFAAEGVTCQSCHMPQGEHSWKGIHDPEMVRSGLAVTASLTGQVDDEGVWALLTGGKRVQALLTATNVGAGHRLPTYTTPEIHLIMEQIDQDGVVIDGTQQQTTIARRMKPDLTQEFYDTRLLPGESHSLEYDQKLSGRAQSIRAKVEVWPDEAYRRNYEIWLKRDRYPTGKRQLETAMQASIDSRYILWTQTIAL